MITRTAFNQQKLCFVKYMVLGTHTDQEVDVFCFCPFGMFGSFSSQTCELEEGNKLIIYTAV